MDKITTQLGQEIGAGDICVCMNIHGPTIELIRKISPREYKYDALIPSVRYSGWTSVYIRGYQPSQWDTTLQKYTPRGDYHVASGKSRGTNFNKLIKIDLYDLDRKFSFHKAVVDRVHEELQKLKDGFYDKKPKSRKVKV